MFLCESNEPFSFVKWPSGPLRSRAKGGRKVDQFLLVHALSGCKIRLTCDIAETHLSPDLRQVVRRGLLKLINKGN